MEWLRGQGKRARESFSLMPDLIMLVLLLLLLLLLLLFTTWFAYENYRRA